MKDAEPTANDYVQPIGEEEKEKVAYKICERFCHADMDWMEICGMHRVKFVDFMAWVMGNPAVNRMYHEASVVAKTLTNIRMYFKVDQILMQSLQDGGVYTETSQYKKRLLADGSEYMDEVSKSKIKRGFGIGELALLKKMLLTGDFSIGEAGDEFDGMDAEQLSQYIEDNKHLAEGLE